MPVKFLLLLLVVVGLITNSIGDNIVKRLKNRYNSVPATCFDSRGNEKPAYECSGIMIRGVNSRDPNMKFAWGMKDLNLKKDGFSLAYLRRDQKFSSFPRHYDSGFIIYPHLKTPAKKNTYKVFCSFPMDGWTDYRHGHGCGKTIGDLTRKSMHCDEQDIISFAHWKTYFNRILNNGGFDFKRRQCAFDMTLKSAPKYFDISLKANAYIQSLSKDYAFRNNELKMHAWRLKKAKRLPIEAFFYLIGSVNGKLLAEKYQDQFFERSGGEIVPIVGIRLPTVKKKFEVKYHKRTPRKHK